MEKVPSFPLTKVHCWLGCPWVYQITNLFLVWGSLLASREKPGFLALTIMYFLLGVGKKD